IIRKNSFDRIIYLGDTLRLPYGNNDKETLLGYARENMDFLLAKGADKVVIACGTISSNVLDELKEEYDTEIIGIIDVLCEEGMKQTRNGKIGVIATPATIRTHIFRKKIKDAEVFEMPCEKFTPLIEGGKIDSKEMDEAIEEYIGPLKKAGIDTLLLGCTHYPLLADKISAFFGSPLKMINSGTVLKDMLSEGELKEPELEFYVSGDTEDFRRKTALLFDIRGTENVKKMK
ncbi:MAG: glutamate racemase, partial [Erysipelotrichaceae bacterium]|nr:glutamate racemase [Erysipelotrichaceae bacterium]